ncbi:hypothetical protein GCM10023321_72350 [Pseudonocardia eucalypti]|uniref:DUF8017 domain-containing protein n=1 Tax=Pseudonocardia eucalypti TaxID=648755 RepID=A0ABP9R6X9_9PSEU
MRPVTRSPAPPRRPAPPPPAAPQPPAAPPPRAVPQPPAAPPPRAAPLPPPYGRVPPGARRHPNELLAQQRLTEPPAGFGHPPPRYPHHPEAGAPATRPLPTDSGRRWLLVGVALVAVAVLGVAGTFLVLRKHASADPPGKPVNAAGVSYRVPPEWAEVPGAPGTTIGGVALDGVATGPRYSCAGHGRNRVTVGSTLLFRRDGSEPRPEDAVRSFGPLFAASFYGGAAEVVAERPAPRTVAGVAGAAGRIEVRPPDPGDCPGLTGRLYLLALPTPKRGEDGRPAVVLLVVQQDLGGGPPEVPTIDESTVMKILDSARVADR